MPSYEKRGDFWSIRFWVNGKQQRLSGFKTKRAATEAYLKASQEKAPPEPDGMMFEELTRRYLEKKKTELKDSSYYEIEKLIENHITPTFGKKAVKDITKADIMEWQTAKSNYSKKYREKLRTYMNGICKFGDLYFDIDNVVAHTEPIRTAKAKKPISFWTEDEFHKFITVVDDPTLHALFLLLYTAGCRKGEALALNAADFTDHRVKISKSITRKVQGRAFAVTSPKNASSEREVSLPEKVIKACLALPTAKSGAFLFGGERPLAENTLTRDFDRYIAAAGVKRIRIHDLRHSCASLLISHGASIVAVANHLGHATVTQTLNTYAHMMPKDASNIMATLEGVL